MNAQFKKGALELCVLAILSEGDCYGYDLVTQISEHISITEGTIYPLLRRLKDDGQVETYLQESSSGPPRKYYRITEHGREVLASSTQEWNDFVAGVYSILLHRKLSDFSKEWQKFLQSETIKDLGKDLYTVQEDLGKMTEDLSNALGETLRAFFNERNHHHE
ncbi:MAG: PadR family transcriptional regulator [Faecalimonas sp.]|nr:PadR family transcriptional regulator [Candidatus Faecimorpha stercoravium]